ncbi:MAG: hypothetical protein V4503_11175 [Gemmatimonadota bacterium]
MNRVTTALGWTAVVLTAVAVGVTWWHRGDAGTELPYLTVRGEAALFRGSGIYRFDPAAVAREGLIWDLVNGLAGVPLLVVMLVKASHGSLRARIALAGFSFYFAYVYLMYATMSAFNPLFLVYVAIVAVSGSNLFLLLASIEVGAIRSHLRPGFPRRFFASYVLLTAAGLVMLWLGRIVPILRSGTFPPELAGVTTLETQAMDLGLVVPLLLATGILLLRDHRWGYLLTGIVVTFGLMLDLTIPAWIISAAIRDGTFRQVEAAPFLVLAVAGATLAATWWLNVVDHPAPVIA